MLDKEMIKARIRGRRAQLKALGIELIGLFGSYVRGEQREGSDIDLLIAFEADKASFTRFMDACHLLDDLFAGNKVEVVTRDGLSPYIGPKILQEVEYV